MLGLDIAYLYTTFDDCNFSRFRDGWCLPRFKWFTWPGQGPFRDCLPSCTCYGQPRPTYDTIRCGRL